MHRFLGLGLALVAGCGGAVAGDSGNALTSAEWQSSAPGTTCAAIAAEYHAAFAEALACDPAAPAACTEWRPLAVSEGSDAATAQITGLCYVAYVGYVTPQRTAALDAIIARYTSAGCTVASCPGPAPHDTSCARNASGNYTCGGM